MENIIKTVTIIYNPQSSRFDKNILEKVKEKLSSRDIETAVVESCWAGHVVSLVKKYNPMCDLIVSIGGDGTMGECFQGFFGEEQRALYTHLSTGATNDSADNFGLIKNDVPASFDMILNGTVKDIDVMTVNRSPFSYISAFGFVANVPYDTPHNLKRRLGRAAYVLYAVKEFVKLPRKMQLKYTVDGEETEETAVLAIISNSKNFAGVEIHKNAKLDDGLFEVLFLRRATPKLIAQVFADYLKDDINFDHYGDAAVTFLADEVTVNFDNGKMDFDLCNDGDKYTLDRDDLSLCYKIGGRLKMLLPTEFKIPMEFKIPGNQDGAGNQDAEAN
ncbi:MAG: hypothetical protein FWF08_05835 [Oscillospiraceae bacterium]|nr:hypothetical protein [Oscillospiraceae bacterium]